MEEREIDFERPDDSGEWHHMEEGRRIQKEWENWYEEYERDFRFVNPLMNKDTP